MAVGLTKEFVLGTCFGGGTTKKAGCAVVGFGVEVVVEGTCFGVVETETGSGLIFKAEAGDRFTEKTYKLPRIQEKKRDIKLNFLSIIFFIPPLLNATYKKYKYANK
ncbi:hypothetical protein R6Q59_006874 [Mikania micrantha]